MTTKSPDGMYIFLEMPFGLKDVPSTFQHEMNIILSVFNWKFVLEYLDDIVIISRFLEEHLNHLQIVLRLLSIARISLKLKNNSSSTTALIIWAIAYSLKDLEYRQKQPTKLVGCKNVLIGLQFCHF